MTSFDKLADYDISRIKLLTDKPCGKKEQSVFQRKTADTKA